MTKMMPDHVFGAGIAAALSLGMVLATGPAVAQEDPPPLPTSEVRNLGPRPLGPAPLRDLRREREDVPTRRTAATRAIQLKPLSAPIIGDPTDAANAAEGLGRDAWTETPEALVPTLLRALPIGAPSPTMGALTLALLSTPGPAPEPRTVAAREWGSSTQPLAARVNLSGSGAAMSQDPEIDRLRFSSMLDAGFFEHVTKRINDAKGSTKVSPLDDILAASLLLQGDKSQACDLSLDYRLQSEEPFWIKLRAFCYLENGTPAAAQLTADLLRDKGMEAPAFYALIRQLTGGEGASDEDLAGPLSPLEFALLRKAGRLPPEEALTQSSAAPLRGFVVHHTDFGGTGADILLLKSAQKAILTGAVSPKELQALYDRIGFPPHEPGKALEFAKSLPPELAPAFYYQQAKEVTVPVMRVEILYEALAAADAADHFLPTVLAYGDLITALEPNPVMSWAGGLMGLGALALGDTDKAMAWYELLALEAGRAQTPGMIAARDRLALALMVADEKAARVLAPHMDIGALIARAANNPKAARRLARNLQLLNATGIGLPTQAELWLLQQNQVQGVQPPPVSVTARLADAVNQRRIAEAIALSLAVAGKDGPQAESPYFVAQSVRALSVLGLNREARRLALEAILAPAT